MFHSRPFRVVVCGLFAVALSSFAPLTAGAQSLEEKIKPILPTAEEDRWLEIPWRTNIAEARAEAELQKKPVFLWVMNGNPLGCA